MKPESQSHLGGSEVGSAGDACPLCSGFPGAESVPGIPAALIPFALFLLSAGVEDEALLS